MAVSFLAGLILIGSGLAAPGHWHDYYVKGQKAIEAGRWPEAIDSLKKAIAEDPKSSQSKVIEGVFRSEYFPYYYLGKAYLNAGDPARAEENFKKELAQGKLTASLRADAEKLRQDAAVQIAQAIKPQPAAKPPTPPIVSEEAKTLNPRFQTLVNQAETAFAERRYEEALGKYDEARKLEPSEFQKRNHQGHRDEADRYITQGRDLAGEGQRLLNEGNLAEAKKKLEAALKILPDEKTARDGLRDIVQREQQYARLTGDGQKLVNEGKLIEARKKFQEADKVFPSQKIVQDALAALDRREKEEAQRLDVKAGFDVGVKAYKSGRYSEARNSFLGVLAKQPGNREASDYLKRAESRIDLEKGQELAAQGQYQKAEAMLQAALTKDRENRQADDLLKRSRRFADLLNQFRISYNQRQAGNGKNFWAQLDALDPKRLEREKDFKRWTEFVSLAPPQGPVLTPGPTVRQGVHALFRGEIQDSIDTLAKVQKNGGDKSADLHAYLGVAYATAAFLSSDEKEAKRLHMMATQEFRQVLSLRRDYKLSERLISPRIIKFFESVRLGS